MDSSQGTNRSAAFDRAGSDAFAELLPRCRRPVFVYAMSLLHNAADAEEVLQETEILLWQKFAQYEPGTDFVAWACGIARFEALKLLDKRSREKRLFSDGFAAMLAEHGTRSSESFEARQEALRQCLGKLRESDRNLVLGRYQTGSTTRSMAERLRRSLQGTRKSLHRIREALAECVRRTLAREAVE